MGNLIKKTKKLLCSNKYIETGSHRMTTDNSDIGKLFDCIEENIEKWNEIGQNHVSIPIAVGQNVKAFQYKGTLNYNMKTLDIFIKNTVIQKGNCSATLKLSDGVLYIKIKEIFPPNYY